MVRTAEYGVPFDCNESGDVYTVLNAASHKGFTLKGVYFTFEPQTMSGPSAVLPFLDVQRYTGTASGGSTATPFPYTDGDVAGTTAITSTNYSSITFGSSPIGGPGYGPGYAGYTGSAWYLHGGQYFTNFDGEIYVAAGNSILVHISYALNATAYFSENLTP